MTTATIEERVAAGALLLDVNVVGWAQKINQHRLKINSYCDCIVGQLYGNYFDGRRQLFPDSESLVRDASAHGFSDPDQQFQALRAAWLHQIRLRLSAPVTVPVDVSWTDHAGIPELVH